MACEEIFRKALKAHGLRMTGQREAILKALHATHHPVSVEEIYAAAHKNCSVLDLSTVYRTLDLFQEFGIVSVVNTHGLTFYEHLGLAEPHIHLLCNSCGKIFSIPLGEVQPFLNVLNDRYQFQVDPTEINFQGLCDDCQEKTSENN